MTTAAQFFAWRDATVSAALAHPIGKAITADDSNWRAHNTGGNCMAWALDCLDGQAQILICDDCNGLGDDGSESFHVGLHPFAEWDNHFQHEFSTIDAALYATKMLQAARAFAVFFRPDAPLTLAEFVGSRDAAADIGAVVGVPELSGSAGFVYCGSAYIQTLESGEFFLNIYNQEWVSRDLAPLEARLYGWAVLEGLCNAA